MNSEPHLDAEALAAWAEDRLSGAERAALEAHASDCERCQALLAAMVRTEPPVEAKPAWSLLAWTLPLTAAAAALIWLVASPATNREPKVVETTAQVFEESPSPAPSSPAPVLSRSSKLADELKTKPERQDFARSRNEPLDKVQTETGAAGALGGAVAAPVAAPAAPALQPPSEAARADRAAGAAAAKERVGTLAETVTTTNAAPAVAMSKALSAVPLPEIVSSNPASRWRITRTPGLLQHSTDGGATWEPQQTNSPVELTAGYSPQPSVCWMVGRAGTVLLTTDNRTWRRVPFPEPADLVAVTATDKDTATVTTRDGAKFSTSDGGVTWDREPVQENPATPF